MWLVCVCECVCVCVFNIAKIRTNHVGFWTWTLISVMWFRVVWFRVPFNSSRLASHQFGPSQQLTFKISLGDLFSIIGGAGWNCGGGSDCKTRPRWPPLCRWFWPSYFSWPSSTLILDCVAATLPSKWRKSSILFNDSELLINSYH